MTILAILLGLALIAALAVHQFRAFALDYEDPRDNTRARSADMYEIPAPDFCGANTRCSASSPGAPLTGGADFPVEAPPAFLSEIHHDHVHQCLLREKEKSTDGFACLKIPIATAETRFA